MRRLVVVGASLAGLRAVQGARAEGWDGEIVVVGEEPHPPYSRPPLSKELLGRDPVAPDGSLLGDPPEASWRLGERASGLDRAARRVVLAGGETIAYDRLVIATGCRPRRWAGAGAALRGLHEIRTLEDAARLREELARATRLAVVGAGFIGCEVAASARSRGVEVDLFDLAPVPMPVLGEELGRRCGELHRAHGVNLRLGVEIAALRGERGRFAAVELADGRRFEADLAVIALGAIPATGWLAGSGLGLEPGVRCDATLSAEGDPAVLAAGDVAAWPSPLGPAGRLRVEHWTNASEQGALAGRNAVRAPAERQPFRGLPSFWSDQHGVRIQAAGLPRLAARFHPVEESPDRRRLVAVGERDGRLVAVVAFDAARRLPAYRRLVGGPLDLDALRAGLAAEPRSLAVAAAPTSTRPTTPTTKEAAR